MVCISKYPCILQNIEDETIFKRHQKPEMEEKKRKRWDMQRLREQRALEKLQERYRQNNRSVDDGPSGRKRDVNEGEVETLHPCLEDSKLSCDCYVRE